MRDRKKWFALAACASMLVLAGCAPEAPAPAPVPPAASGSDTEQREQTAGEPEADVAAQPRTQEESCDWETPAISGGAEAPTDQAGELSTVIVGAWQHTHFDTGAGFEPVGNDIRYVFPSSERILYCQHVPGITDHAENAADFTLNGTTIELPGAPGYVVSEWNDDTMVWINRADDSLYLLQRR